MHMPKYDGVIEKWKVDLIITRAKFMGFRKHEIPDALQEIVLELLRFDYDPNHANGAQERTALTSVIDNRLRKMVRSAMRYAAHVERSATGVRLFSTEEVSPQAVDIAAATASLTLRERAICRGLARGLSKAEVAKRLRCGWHTVDRVVRRLRRDFRQLGLDGWIDE